MLGYFCKRILLIIPCIMAVILLIFLLMSTLAGTDTAHMVRYADDARGAPGLSFLEQYGKYCFRVFVRQDFGLNGQGMSLRNELSIRTAATLEMTISSVLLTYIIGVPLGVFAACRRGRWQDSVITTVTTFLSSIPAFCLSLALMLLFGARLRWMNVVPETYADKLVPISILAVIGAANVAKVTRAGMAEVLDKPFILTLTAMGLSRRRVILRHALKNALIPAFSVFTTVVAQLLCGSIVVERFYAIRGLGSSMISAVVERATTTLLGCAVVVALIMSVCSVLTDLLFVLVNPSLRATLSFGSTLRRRSGR
ncbi:MAG: ABC transporter permease [Oscillospiraceae bacterium]|nr:ABC transporter permease [Oscillospiraceae bacterium]